MRAICVDDERLLMEDTVSTCLELPEIDEAKGFVRPQDALKYLESTSVDLAILDIDMPGMSGIELAATIKNRWPDTRILFLTGYSQYAVEAFAVRASGYLLKPVSKENLARDVAYALEGKKKKLSGHVVVKTFGNFDVYVDGKPVSFKLAKSKELFAYLVDKQGAGVTRAELFAAAWEDRLYDRKMQKQLDTYIRSLRETLQEYGILQILEMEKGVLRVKPDLFVCDAYLFYAGDRDAINTYRGEYMSSYSWASITEAILFWKSTSR